MKMKKLVATVVAVTLVSAMMVTGCGKGSKDSDTFRIGGTGPLTGDASSYGTSVKNGAELAVKEINDAGGINGKKIEFDMKDDKATAEDASTAYNSLMDWGMQVSIGSTTSGSCEAFASSSLEDKIFAITPSASAATVIETGDNMFRVCFGDPDQGVLAAKELQSYDKIGAIYDTSDTYSTGIYEAFKAEMKSLKKEYIEQSFDAENKKDFSTQVEALKDCDVIFLPIYYTEAGLIAKACSYKGCNALLFGCDGFDGIADQLDNSVSSKIKYITPFDVNSNNEKTAAFVKAYQAKYSESPDQFAADAYDAIYAIKEAMEKAKVDDTSISPSDLCDKIVKAITSKDFKLEGATGTMTWDKSGACTKEPQIVELN